MPGYSKPAKTYAEQIAILTGRGLVVGDPAFAEHCLAHHNYYRISAYRFPLTLPGNPDQFVAGTTFEALWALYEFDRQLRAVVAEACKRVEISVRAHWAYALGHKYGCQAYEMPSVFSNTGNLRTNLKQLDAELARSGEIFVKHFETTYGALRPPIWAACEVMSFGLISKFVDGVKLPADRQAVAKVYSLDEKTLVSFLRHLTTIRNTCAHHSRLWNRDFAVTFQPPKSKPAALVPSLVQPPPGTSAPKRIYNTLVVLGYMMDLIQGSLQWRHRVRDLIRAQAFPVPSHMGFPADWLTRPIWMP